MADDTAHRELPEAFVAGDPGQNSGDDQAHGKFGAGHLVGSAVPEQTQVERREESDGDSDSAVDEASDKSFPGSDPPSFGRTTST